MSEKDPADILKNLLVASKMMVESQKELQALYDQEFAIWKEKKYEGYSPNNEVTIQIASNARVEKVTIDPTVDTNNKTLVELLVKEAVNDAINKQAAGFKAYNAKCDEHRDAIGEKYKKLSAADQPEETKQDLLVEGTENVFDFSTMMLRNKNNNSKKD